MASIAEKRRDNPSPGDTNKVVPKSAISPPPSNPLGDTVVDPSPVIEEFQYLLEKSQQLFSGLRDLTPLGSRHWRGYFQKTFEVYTRLFCLMTGWHSGVLVEAYGLKRWEIGEIASKIGQLYYHYYLRTSERRYLQESSVFYDAIRDRDYFTDIFSAHNPGLAVKLLRYYARFIVVSLLLNNKSIGRVLLDELTAAIDEYKRLFKGTDITEWQTVIQEIKMFIEAESQIIPKGVDEEHALLPNLNSSVKASIEREESQRLHLQEVILVGHQRNQIKFSELTVDVYRMMQTLEQSRTVEKTEEARAGMATTSDPGHASSNAAATAAAAASITATTATASPAQQQAQAQAPPPPSQQQQQPSPSLRNPHKYILFKPTFSQLITHIATAFQDININTVLLLFLSADGVSANARKPERDLLGTASRVKHSTTEDSPSWFCLHPGDLRPFTRKPLFLVVESDNSIAYRHHATHTGHNAALWPASVMSPIAHEISKQRQVAGACATGIAGT
ncbi:protein SCAI [Syncephalis pseudoplumigaleata]|uniref:Protein SCAI n=1 Tax=Syncephalis pseudoplumigaleata TaxID=1712513 RepID=A0A4P9YV38_9FUNG|nr:protein SCAI [Syncephalis pseudoplumigaleata]|eukprot:RKP23913.1 protein SCAI [Syncephalis pseudoplumigaleata]